jgi:hypothetical protein
LFILFDTIFKIAAKVTNKQRQYKINLQNLSLLLSESNLLYFIRTTHPYVSAADNRVIVGFSSFIREQILPAIRGKEMLMKKMATNRWIFVFFFYFCAFIHIIVIISKNT